jgi:tetratricopeptide (TPR) repeat protein
MPCTTSIQQAIRLNSQALALIDAGNFDAAIPTLSRALKASKQTLNCADYEVECAPLKISLDQCMLDPRQPRIVVDELSNGGERDRQGGRHMYRRAIRIPEASIETSTYESSIMISVIIMFNLALTHHLMATSETTNNSSSNKNELLRKAIRLYELAYSLQQTEGFLENASLFTMATINNMGLIHQSLGESAVAGKYFQHLLSILVFLVDCGESRVAVLHELCGFLRNTSHLILKKGAAAAA